MASETMQVAASRRSLPNTESVEPVRVRMGDLGEDTGESGSTPENEEVGVLDMRRRSDGLERMCDAMSSGDTAGAGPDDAADGISETLDTSLLSSYVVVSFAIAADASESLARPPPWLVGITKGPGRRLVVWAAPLMKSRSIWSPSLRSCVKRRTSSSKDIVVLCEDAMMQESGRLLGPSGRCVRH